MTHRIRSVVARTALATIAALAVAPIVPPLEAQLIRVPSADESARPVIVSVAAGLLQTQGRFDGQSGADWALGESFQYRASLETSLRSGSSVGFTATLASVPIRRSVNPGAEGDIQFRQFMATFRSPEGRGFYQLIELAAGLSQWAGYQGDDVLTADERKARNGLALVIGFGFGIQLGDRAAITIVQDAGTVIGSAEGLPSGVSRVQRQYTTRLGLRLRVAGGR
ncbi:MAG: hypothetical protein WD771_00550 [Gemmatimonadaceae bacterium]